MPWTGKPCPACEGSGRIVKEDGVERGCCFCGGTGEGYVLSAGERASLHSYRARLDASHKPKTIDFGDDDD